MPTITHCVSCKAPIFWAIVRGAKRGSKPMPVDAEPLEGGNLRMLNIEFPVVLTMSAQLELGELDDGVRYQSHFASCPDADAWRGGRARHGDTPGPDYRKPRV